MRNELDFKVPSNPWMAINFMQCFTNVYMFLENIDLAGEMNPICKAMNNGTPCHGCGNCEAANKQVLLIHMFDMISGNISWRCRFDGKPTEMQKLMIGESLEDEVFDTDSTVDFLFGFVGYDYRKCTDPATFQEFIKASIDRDKPVLAKIKAGKGRFHLITGYDGDSLISPYDYWYAKARPNGPPVYDEIVELYVFGDKIVPRYMLKDGLERIVMVRKYNINEKFWDEYLAKLGSLDQVDVEEIKARVARMTDTLWYNIGSDHSLGIALRDCLHEEMRNPALSALWGQIRELAHYPDSEALAGKLGEIDWAVIKPVELQSISAEICSLIVKFKEDDLKLLDLFKQAIKILGDE